MKSFVSSKTKTNDTASKKNEPKPTLLTSTETAKPKSYRRRINRLVPPPENKSKEGAPPANGNANANAKANSKANSNSNSNTNTNTGTTAAASTINKPGPRRLRRFMRGANGTSSKSDAIRSDVTPSSENNDCSNNDDDDEPPTKESWMSLTENSESGEPNNQKDDGKKVTGAAIAGGVAGLVVAGPVLAVAGGIGAAVAASQNKGNVGDAARATGEAVNAIGDKAKEVDEKHHVVEKTKNVFSAAIDNLKKFDEKHKIVEKTTKGIADGANFVATKIRESSNKNKPEKN